MMKQVAICLATLLLAIPAAAQNSRNDKKDTKQETKKLDPEKIEIRNNAASLLADLLGSEKDVSKILIIKHNSPELGQLIKSISKTADDGAKDLEALAAADKTLDLHTMELPPGEKATRDAISKTKEHELIFSSGDDFQLNLLLTQTDALNYGSHLAKIAADNSASPEQQNKFHMLDVNMDKLLKQVVAQIRAIPPASKPTKQASS